MSLKFLHLKSFHPSNKRNQKKKFIAEENAKNKAKSELERAREFQEEQEFIKNRELMTGSKLEGEKVKVGFLYAPPPGYQDEKLAPQSVGAEQDNNTEKKRNISDYTDVEMFPFLANAPKEGEYINNIQVTHKPFGIQLRKVKCIRCGEFGHKSGDRQCPLLEINPNESNRLKFEDPFYNNNSNSNNNRIDNKDSKKRYNNNNSNNKFKTIVNNEQQFGANQSPSLSEYVPYEPVNNKSYNDVVDDEEDDDDDDYDDEKVEREFLASLTKHQRKILLRQIKLEEKQLKRKSYDDDYSDSSSDFSDDSSDDSSDNSSDDSSDDSKSHKHHHKRKKKKYSK